jgi:ureidoacrylate peracid hydrolase
MEKKHMNAEHREAAMTRALFPTLPEFDIVPSRTALVTIDMQYLDADPDYGLGRKAQTSGEFELVREYFDEVATIVPRIARLQNACRRAGVEIIHVCIAPKTEDARECPPVTRMLNIRPPRGTRETEILDALKPRGDEMILAKITSSAFNSTSLNLILHNMGIDALVVCGVITNGCVESTVRDARDLGYNVIVAGDCCATWTRESHERALRFMAISFANVRTCDELVNQVETRSGVGVA